MHYLDEFFIFSKYAFPSDIASNMPELTNTGITILLKENWVILAFRVPNIKGKCIFRKNKKFARDNAWRIVRTNFELNPTHRSGPTKKKPYPLAYD